MEKEEAVRSWYRAARKAATDLVGVNTGANISETRVDAWNAVWTEAFSRARVKGREWIAFFEKKEKR
jgi:hypothetical protein